MASDKASRGTISYDPTGIHQLESVYSTPLSSLLQLHEINKFIHSIPSLPHAVEFLVFLFGYAFNPVSIPLWMVAASLSGVIIPSNGANNNIPEGSTATLYAPIFYLATVLVTLIGTELCKASFRATRPEAILSLEYRASKLRRYGTLVASLKSKHSFPSGDSAQAANVVLFWFFYVLPLWQQQQQSLDQNTVIRSIIHMIFAFGIFYPGVAFARIFYHCHWIEDCLGGAILAAVLHRTVIPIVSNAVWKLYQQWFIGG